ncbi:MAG: hypothetical protein AAGF94_15320 [Pseudomonadota bacterium]
MTAITDTARFHTQDITHTIVTILTAGAFATLAFDFFGQSLSPWLGFSKLAPVPLTNGVIAMIFGQGFTPAAHAMHYFVGLIGYSLGWVLIIEPLRARFAPEVPWLAAAVVYGVALWVWALYFMAHLLVGNPAFLGFTQITWVALVGHVVYAVVAAWVTELRAKNI